MTQKSFIKILEEKGYSYKTEGDKIVVTHRGRVYLRSLTSLPPGVEFKNGGNVDLSSLTSLPPGVQFENGWNVYLNSLETLPPGVEFKNNGDVDLSSLKTLPPGVEFKNGRDVFLPSLIGGRFGEWYGNIKGIDGNRLLNKMIELGLFDR